MLAAKDDAYGGVIIDPDALPSDPEAFAKALEHSVKEWRAQGKRGVWLKVPISKAHLVGPAAGASANGSSTGSNGESSQNSDAGGFQFHHAESDYVMMTRWLQEGVPSTLPPNASHQVGVGAFVINEKSEVLMVQEAMGPLKGKQVWKMPTGLVHQGEDLIAAAEREVLEEAGVSAAFDSVICVRQAHGFQFGKSDLFVCVGLRTTEPGQQPRPCEVEIEAVRWMPLAEYRAQFFQSGVPLYEKLLDRCMAWAEGRYSGWKGAKLQAGMWGRDRLDTLLWGEDGAGSDRGGGAAQAGNSGGPGKGQQQEQAGAQLNNT